MSNVIETFEFSKDGIDFSVSVVCYDECAMFADQWEMTDKHEGGITVKNPDYGRNSYKYAKPLQYSLAERARDLVKRGADNPSRDAYKAAQDALGRDLSASDYGFEVTADCNGVSLLDAENIGCSFDYSYDDDQTLIEIAREVFEENGIDVEALEAAKKAANDILSKVDSLKNIAN